MIFVFETHCGLLGLPTIKGYNAICDPHYSKTYGGIACFIKDSLLSFVDKIKYFDSYISFKLSNFPAYTFIATYIQPTDSKYFYPELFSKLASHIISQINNGYIPLIGGDFNSRLKDLNYLSQLCNSDWKYDDNVDNFTNSHSSYFKDLCISCNILPLNHLKLRNVMLPGQFTYRKSDKKSQIDYILLNQAGLNCLNYFKFDNSGFSYSDHTRLIASFKVVHDRPLLSIYKRSMIFLDNNHQHFSVKKVHNFDYDVALNMLYNSNLYYDVENSLNSCDLESTINNIDNMMNTVLSKCKISNNNINLSAFNISSLNQLEEDCNNALTVHINAINNSPDSALVNSTKNIYDSHRHNILHYIAQHQSSEWTYIESTNNERLLWNKISWNGDTHKQENSSKIDTDTIKDHFEKLYSNYETDITHLDALNSSVYIPILDDPISEFEIDESFNTMKKGGSDFSQNGYKLLFNYLRPHFLLLMNMIFYMSYPFSLTTSVLTAVFKKGSMTNPNNYRGIQCTKAIANHFDRILSKRLTQWANLCDEQSAYTTNRSTIDQIFYLNIIFTIAKKHNITLYIGLFDLSKAFDLISRYKLLARLIQLGIGSAIFNAIKNMYSLTLCVLKFANRYSDLFEILSGIRQGSSSSCILFIIFMDKLIRLLKDKCIREPLLGLTHCLLHADDTLLLSTSKELFIKKCELTFDFFSSEDLHINLDKTCFMIINPGSEDHRLDLVIRDNILKYKSSHIYLGHILSDSGSITVNFKMQMDTKSPNVTLKLRNFISKNYFAPLHIKYKVMNSCVNSCLLYACETWGNCSLNKIDIIHRSCIKILLGIRQSTSNNIVYLESGTVPIHCQIYYLQLKYWLKISSYIQHNPSSYLNEAITLATNNNIPFIKHYISLYDRFQTPANCYNYFVSDFQASCRNSFDNITDINLPSGIYKTININLEKPIFDNFEPDRQIITRYRTGSHNLLVEKGRWTRIPRNQRLCDKCSSGEIQNLFHVLYRCDATRSIHINFHSICEFFNSPNCAYTLRIVDDIFS